jgi:hypothetical protein
MNFFDVARGAPLFVTLCFRQAFKSPFGRFYRTSLIISTGTVDTCSETTYKRVIATENTNMNKVRRNELNTLHDRITELKSKIEETLRNAAEEMSNIRDDLNAVRDDEDEAFNNLSEGFQNSERGETMQEAINQMDEASVTLDRLSDEIDFENIERQLDEAFEAIENAKGEA